MDRSLKYLLQLSHLAEKKNHRFLVRLRGRWQWQQQLFSQFISHKTYSNIVKLGGEVIAGASLLNYKQGKMLLGNECDCLFYDASGGFDSNSITAASGALIGGGLLFLNYNDPESGQSDWISRHLADSITLDEDGPDPIIPIDEPCSLEMGDYSEQIVAINCIDKVVSGHRKRPFVLTADRGRGKSSALGIAAANLMSSRHIQITVTAPSRNSVDPVFEHAISTLSSPRIIGRNEVSFNQSKLNFVSPDELIAQEQSCDLLLIDEASAIPTSMLEALVNKYPRVVLSSTIHGYEGCGRGFTLKFFPWLDQNRPGWHHYHIHQAIRWNEGDPLEQWIFNAFLLNSEMSKHIEPVPSSSLWQFTRQKKKNLVKNSALFGECFSLLVNAHYQTSPNDLLQILDDDSIHLYTLCFKEDVYGCLVVKVEGEMSQDIAQEIVAGRRRPKGHLAPILIASQLGIAEAVYPRCLRVMRIAVSPYLQNLGMGSFMLRTLFSENELSVDYMATSFGVTRELFSFWKKNEFSPVRLGTSCDHASGTYSLLMLKPINRISWMDSLQNYFFESFLSLLSDSFRSLNAGLVADLLKGHERGRLISFETRLPLVEVYAQGGSSYESALSAIKNVLLDRLLQGGCDGPDLLINKVLQQRSWQSCAKMHNFSGRKQTENELRNKLLSLL